MIRLAQNKDKDKIIDLWKEAFDDEKWFIVAFIEYVLENEKLYIWEKEDELVSMLAVIRGEGIDNSEGNRKIQEVGYIYGVATALKYRKMGYSKLLMQHLLKEFRKEKIDAILVPENAGLFDFYKKIGFEIFSNMQRRKIDYKENHNILEGKIENFKSISFEEYNIIREKFLKDFHTVKFKDINKKSSSISLNSPLEIKTIIKLNYDFMKLQKEVYLLEDGCIKSLEIDGKTVGIWYKYIDDLIIIDEITDAYRYDEIAEWIAYMEKKSVTYLDYRKDEILTADSFYSMCYRWNKVEANKDFGYMNLVLK